MATIDYLTVVLRQTGNFESEYLDLISRGTASWSRGRRVVRVKSLYRNDLDTLKLVRKLVQAGVAKVTRIDVENTYLSDLSDIAAKAVSKARTGGRFKGNGGQTYYVGSRRSAMFVRVYDKAAELRRKGVEVPVPLWRAEVEVKRKAANEVFLAVELDDLAGSLDRIYSLLIRKMKLELPDDKSVHVEDFFVSGEAKPAYRHLGSTAVKEVVLSLRRQDGVAEAFLEEILKEVRSIW